MPRQICKEVFSDMKPVSVKMYSLHRSLTKALPWDLETQYAVLEAAVLAFGRQKCEERMMGLEPTTITLEG